MTNRQQPYVHDMRGFFFWLAHVTKTNLDCERDVGLQSIVCLCTPCYLYYCLHICALVYVLQSQQEPVTAKSCVRRVYVRLFSAAYGPRTCSVYYLCIDLRGTVPFATERRKMSADCCMIAH